MPQICTCFEFCSVFSLLELGSSFSYLLCRWWRKAVMYIIRILCSLCWWVRLTRQCPCRLSYWQISTCTLPRLIHYCAVCSTGTTSLEFFGMLVQIPGKINIILFFTSIFVFGSLQKKQKKKKKQQQQKQKRKTTTNKTNLNKYILIKI